MFCAKFWAMFCAKFCANIGSSEDALCSARSTVAIRLSIRVPVNFIFNVPIFLAGTRPCSLLLGRSRKTPPQSVFKNLYPARLTITAPGARQFLRGKLNLDELNSRELKLFRRPASSRCATAVYEDSERLKGSGRRMNPLVFPFH